MRLKPGMIFGWWTTISNADRKGWLCKCKCGKIKPVCTSSLTSGISSSCGCKRNPEFAKEKQCPRCDGVFPATEEFFRKRGTYRRGFKSYCKLCENTYSREYQQKDKERICDRVLSWYHKQKKERPEFVKKKSLEHTLKSKYDMTLKQYDEMLKGQNGVCAVCKNPETNINRYGDVNRLSVDHNHKTGEIRGLLCNNCNLLLGRIEHTPELVIKLQAYLLG